MSIFPSASRGRQRPTPVSASREFVELASAIDPDIPSDRAAELIANFRAAVLNEAAERSESLQTFNYDELRGIQRVTALLRRLVKGGAA
ncbi:hypothetical protein [Streptomyces antimycoticus]|uniref:hypothetical protein n=1 Tax=Streptomyces antimycoticus TaxID=68175 RepID=UPI00386EC07F|nr:hypothetical protein OG751_04500 [Streptomyces antimycoticus]